MEEIINERVEMSHINKEKLTIIRFVLLKLKVKPLLFCQVENVIGKLSVSSTGIVWQCGPKINVILTKTLISTTLNSRPNSKHHFHK